MFAKMRSIFKEVDIFFFSKPFLYQATAPVKLSLAVCLLAEAIRCFSLVKEHQIPALSPLFCSRHRSEQSFSQNLMFKLMPVWCGRPL